MPQTATGQPAFHFGRKGFRQDVWPDKTHDRLRSIRIEGLENRFAGLLGFSVFTGKHGAVQSGRRQQTGAACQKTWTSDQRGQGRLIRASFWKDWTRLTGSSHSQFNASRTKTRLSLGRHWLQWDCGANGLATAFALRFSMGSYPLSQNDQRHAPERCLGMWAISARRLVRLKKSTSAWVSAYRFEWWPLWESNPHGRSPRHFKCLPSTSFGKRP